MNLGEPSVQSIDMGNSWEGGVMAEADLTHEQLKRRTLFQLHLEWRSHGRRLGRCHGTVGGLRSASLPCVDECGQRDGSGGMAAESWARDMTVSVPWPACMTGSAWGLAPRPVVAPVGMRRRADKRTVRRSKVTDSLLAMPRGAAQRSSGNSPYLRHRLGGVSRSHDGANSANSRPSAPSGARDPK